MGWEASLKEGSRLSRHLGDRQSSTTGYYCQALTGIVRSLLAVSIEESDREVAEVLRPSGIMMALNRMATTKNRRAWFEDSTLSVCCAHFVLGPVGNGNI